MCRVAVVVVAVPQLLSLRNFRSASVTVIYKIRVSFLLPCELPGTRGSPRGAGRLRAEVNTTIPGPKTRGGLPYFMKKMQTGKNSVSPPPKRVRTEICIL